jgi:flagellar motor component MotA
MQTPIKRVVSVLIICIGIIVSVWAFAKNKNIQVIQTEISSATSTTPKLFDENDWKRILTGVSQGTTTILASQQVGTYSNEGTRTDQMAKDFLAQYLQLKKGGGDLTKEQINQIVLNIISTPEYTKATGVQYTIKDLHIIPQTDKETAKKYMDDGTAILKKYSNKNYEDVLTILDGAMKSQKEKDLAKLDPIINVYKGIISDILKINVPKDATNLHLALLNAFSNTLSNIEGLRVSLTDPVQSFVSLNQFQKHISDIEVGLNNLKGYFISKGILPLQS